MAAPANAPVSSTAVNCSYTSTAIRFAPWIAKGAIVAGGIFALRQTAPQKLLWAFPAITAFSYASLAYGVHHNKMTQVFHAFKVARMGTAILFGTLGVGRLYTYSSQTLLAKLITCFCFTTALSALDDRVMHLRFYQQMQKLREQSPGIQDLLKAIISGVFRFPLIYLTYLVNDADLQEAAKQQVKTALLSGWASWETVALIENLVGPIDLSVLQTRELHKALELIALLPEERQSTLLDQLLDGFSQARLPKSIEETLIENRLVEEYVTLKLDHLETNPLEPLKQRIETFEKNDQLNLSELQHIETSLKKIIQDINRVSHFSEKGKGEKLKQVREDASKLIIKINPLIKNASRIRTGKIDLTTYFFDHLFSSLSDMLANNTEKRQAKEAELKTLLCRYFECHYDQLYEKMSNSNLATVQDLIDQGICTQAIVEDSATFFAEMTAYLTAHLPSHPSITFNAVWINPKKMTFVLDKILNFSLLIGGITRLATSHFFLQSTNYWRLCTAMAVPFRLYKDLAPAGGIHWVKSESSIHQTHVFTATLLKTIITTYPFVVAACFGYRIPYLKTNSFLFACALGFFY